MLADLNLRDGYNSDTDNILHDFYIPALSKSTKYWRLTGYFSSSAIRVAAQGIRNLIKNGGTMRLITGLEFSEKDAKAIEDGALDVEQATTNVLNEELGKLSEEDFTMQPARVLGWMLKKNILEIKIADVTGQGIYHPKVGILFDEDNQSISFSGANNETARGWSFKTGNVEVFKVFQKDIDRFYNLDLTDFLNFWNKRTNRTKVYDLPEAIKQKLMSIAPEKYEDEDMGYDDGIGSQTPPTTNELWPHQKLAIRAWSDPATWRNNLEPDLAEFLQNQSTDQELTNNHQYQGILSMCTGSGKTFAAVTASCLADENVITIIAMPLTIREQWENEIRQMEPHAKIIYGGGDGDNWKTQLPVHLAGYRQGTPPTVEERLFILCSYDAISNDGFVNLFDGIESQFVQVIGDEVHNFANTRTNTFNIKADRVLGLSATHTRHWDDPGTAEIENYFGKPVYDFNIQDGIDNNFLCHYRYYLYFVNLTVDELNHYMEETRKIGMLQAQIIVAKRNRAPNLAGLQAQLQIALNQRAKIVKKAENKPAAVGNILQQSFAGPNEKAIIFCEDSEQEEHIREMLKEQNKIFNEFSSKVSSAQKLFALDSFKTTDASRFLLGFNCLDEGLDVPESDKCIIVSSTTNPRQFIQRRGRVLRKTKENPTKIAEVYDTIVIPNYRPPNRELTEEEEKEAERMATLIQKEIDRVKQLSDSADNQQDVIRELERWIAANRLGDYVNV